MEVLNLKDPFGDWSWGELIWDSESGTPVGVPESTSHQFLGVEEWKSLFSA